MDEAPASASGSLPLTLAGRIDRACDRYEADWKAGRRPRIEAYLAEASELDHPELLRELLVLEVEFRRRDGERPTADEYRARFPRDERLIISAFEAAAGLSDPADHPKATSRANADRNLLFGFLAGRMGLVSRDATVAAMRAWVLGKSRSLGEILTEQGALSGVQHRLLEALVDEHLRLYGDDPAQSLGTVTLLGSIWEDLAQIADPDLQAGLTRVVTRGPDGVIGTGSPCSVGTPTISGFRFRILRPHAQGGLGRVYLARDEELRREVALKQIQDQYAHDPNSRARFLLEAEITGNLEHPGVVPVYGLGCDAVGRPYYAMRFIRGDSLKQAIARFHAMDDPRREPGERILALRQLLGRFVNVCNTVAYAHSRGVIHRDLKPANILLGPYGETLVVDWGLAKLAGRPEGADRAEGSLELAPGGTGEATLPGSPIGTPQYMSPEQASGRHELLGTASDVYGLGATLYCLLTGQPPVEDRHLATVLQRVQRGEFRPPRTVKRTVAPALEAVCLKAMALRPEDRYSTPRALADDLEHWLGDEPISAWREPVSVRARRWVVRHRTTVATAAGVVLMALVGLGAIATLEDRSRRQLAAKNRELALANARAERRMDLALRAIQSFRQAVEGHIDVEHRADLAPLRKALLREPLEFYRQLKADIQISPDAHPETRARLALANFELAMITAQTDSQENAMRAYREALDVLAPLARDHPEVTKYRVYLASIYGNLGNLQFETGHPDEALVSFQRSRDLREALARDHPAITKYQDHLAAAYNNLGLLCLKVGRPAEALTCLERAIEIQEAIVRDHPAVADHRASLAEFSLDLGRLRSSDRPAESLTSYERARGIAEQLVRDHPADVAYRALLASANWSVGWIQMTLSRLAEASVSYDRAHELYEGLTREQPYHTGYRSALTAILIDLGTLRIMTGRQAQSLPLFQRAQDLLEELIRDHPNDLGLQSRLGKVLDNRGIALAELGRHREAEAAFLEAIARQRIVSDKSPQVRQYREYLSTHYANLARVRRDAGRPAEAADAALERGRLWPGDPDELYSVACDLASCLPLVDRGRAALADRWPAERRKYVGLALEALRQAIRAGYKDIARMRSRPDLDPLRSNEEFQSLVSDLTFPTNPFAQ
jgi:serine/threonine-protein kinase